ERPLTRLSRRPGGDLGGGFLLGLSLGLVFVPCAGPVLTAVTVVAATHHVGVESAALTLTYALGAAVPMLAVAIGGQRGLGGVRWFRAHAAQARAALGAVVAVTPLAV